MHFEVDRQVDDASLARIEHEVGEVLQEVRHAVQDWKSMRERLQEDELARLRTFQDTEIRLRKSIGNVRGSLSGSRAPGRDTPE